MTLMHINKNLERNILLYQGLPRMNLKTSRHGPKKFSLIRKKVTTEWIVHVKRKFFENYKMLKKNQKSPKRIKRERLLRYQSQFAHQNQAACKYTQEEKEGVDEEDEDDSLQTVLQMILNIEIDLESKEDDIHSEINCNKEIDYLLDDNDIELDYV